MPVTGDFAKLDKAINELSKLANPALVQVAATGIAQALATEVQLGFRKEQDPDGNKWPALKAKRKRKGKGKRGNKILRDTGRLANSITGRATGNTAVVGTNVSYGPYHQYGTGGHKASSRAQPTNKKGRFVAKEKAGKVKRGAVAVKLIQFKEGGGKIPARPFLPMATLPESYASEIGYVITQVLKRSAPGFFGKVG